MADAVPEPQVELSALVRSLSNEVPDVQTIGDPAGVVVRDVVFDHRDVTPGALFCCLRGSTVDGHAHAHEAAERGAVALLCDHPLAVDLPQVQVPDTRMAMAPVAVAVFGRPADALSVVGVTGTNGKTTVTLMVKAILDAAGRPAGAIGTLSGVRTTPEAPDLQRQLAGLRDGGYLAAAIEVSSHALAQHRVDGTSIDVAVFTNLSRDHLDYHQTMEAYFQAKARLFEPGMAAHAVVNTDDPHGRLLLDAAQIPTTGYSLDEAGDLHLTAQGSSFTWRGQRIEVPLGGRFNVSNALAAAHAASVLDIEPPVVAAGLAAVSGVAGRFQVLDLGAPFTVVVDFAHTPDGIAQLLEAARELAGGHRVHIVVGCGGDRDRAKRPAMGEVASRLADRLVLTSDNPRSEDPLDIISEALQGVEERGGVLVEPDRRAAIAAALAGADEGDLVLIAGKGHEQFQEIRGQRLPFDDRVVVREEYERMQGGSA